MVLMFQKEAFHEGPNVTVRRGIKWAMAEFKKEEMTPVAINSEFNYRIVGFCYDVSKKVKRFADISEAELMLEHDPDCRTYAGLLEEMKRVYPGFEENEIVTIVTFNYVTVPVKEFMK